MKSYRSIKNLACYIQNLTLPIIGFSLSLIGYFLRKHENRILISSFPDFDDNSKSLYHEAKNNGLEVVFLTTAPLPIVPSWAKGTIVYKYSLKGFLNYFSTKFIFFTHGLYSFLPLSKRQKIINVWHGMPIKRIGHMDPGSKVRVPKFDFTLASDTLFRPIMATAFGVPEDRVLLLGAPRLDLLEHEIETIPGLPPHRIMGLWLPTYRASVIGDVRIDGDPELDIFRSDAPLGPIDEIFAKNDILCLAKPHPMAEVDPGCFSQYKAIKHFNDDDLAKSGLSLYELLGHSDFIITDVSSVYVDYKILNRPIFIYYPDFDQYKLTRGFSLPIEQVTHELILKTIPELAEKLCSDLENGCINSRNKNCQVRKFPHTNKLFETIGLIHSGETNAK